MPTAAKLFAAVFFAIVAGLTAHIYALGLPEGQTAGRLREVSAVVGLLCGWLVMGPAAHRAGRRIDAMGAGIRTSVIMVLFVLLIFACVEVMERAFMGRYKTPLDAVLAVFDHALRMAPPIGQPESLATLLLGGLLGGAFAHWAAKRWN